MDLDYLAEAIDALSQHQAGCEECAAMLPDGECDERKRLKATRKRRQELREAARQIAEAGVRRSSPDHGSPGGAATGTAEVNEVN